MVTKTELLIDNTSPELFEEAIREVPFLPESAEITLTANGVSLPGYKEEGGTERCLSECVERNVIPASNSTLFYDEKTDLFIPRFETGIALALYEELPSEMKQAAVEMMLKGGKPLHVTIKISLDAQKAFSVFREEFLDTLLDNDYHLSEGDLWLSSWHSRQHYNEGYRRSGGLEFAEERLRYNKGLKLDLMPIEANQHIIAWFDALKDKYNPII